MKIPIIIYKDKDGVWIARSPFLPWFHTYWYNKEELFKNIEELKDLYEEMIKNWEIIVDENIDFVMDYYLDFNLSNVNSSDKLKKVA